MKFFLFAISALVCFYSCTATDNINSVIGSWEMQNVVNTTKDTVLLKATFDEFDSLHIETIVNGQLLETVSVSYKLTKDKKYLLTGLNLATPFKFEVSKLTKEDMELRQVGTNRIDRYKRIHD